MLSRELHPPSTAQEGPRGQRGRNLVIGGRELGVADSSRFHALPPAVSLYQCGRRRPHGSAHHPTEPSSHRSRDPAAPVGVSPPSKSSHFSKKKAVLPKFICCDFQRVPSVQYPSNLNWIYSLSLASAPTEAAEHTRYLKSAVKVFLTNSKTPYQFNFKTVYFTSADNKSRKDQSRVLLWRGVPPPSACFVRNTLKETLIFVKSQLKNIELGVL